MTCATARSTWGAAHVFDTTRKAKWVADSLGRRPIKGIELVSPSSLSSEQLVQVHDPAYIRAVETGAPRSLAESQGFCWDAGLWSMVRASNTSAPCDGRLGCILFYTPIQVGPSNTQQGTKTLLQ